ncbi:hypothetical protein ACI1US_00020 [Leucobacter sp. BZR 635]
MFTVILLSASARAIFEPVRTYFEPYIESGEIALCAWDESPRARHMYEAVPGLPELIKGKAAWRAVVIDHPRGLPAHETGAIRDAENPFDFLDNLNPNLNLADSPHALIRIAHILLGYPQLSAKHFEPYLQYEDRDTGELVTGEPRALVARLSARKSAQAAGPEAAVDLDRDRTEEEWFALAAMSIGERHNHVRRFFREVPYSDAEQREHAKLVNRYAMKEVRPSEVVFVATRAPVEEDEKAELRRAWSSELAHVPSRFIERNDYPPMSRFAVYDLLEPENSGYEQDQLRFWLSVLTTATNQFPPGGFQADRVYQLGVEFADEGLGHMLNEHLSQLAHARDRLDRIIRTLPREPAAADDVLQTVETPVAFDDFGGDELQVSDSGYGLATDHPVDEFGRWVGEVNGVSGRAALFMRKPRRAVVRAVADARAIAVAVPEPEDPLTELGREELDDALAQRLEGLVVPTTARILDKEGIHRAIRSGDRAMRGHIEQRMPRSTIAAVALLSLGVWLAAFVPYLFQAGRRGPEPLLHGAGLVLLVLGVLGIAGFATLWAMKLLLLRRIDGFNAAIRAEVNVVKNGADRFAEFLSTFVSYRRGADRIRASVLTSDARAVALRQQRALRERIVRRIDEEKEIVRGLGVPLEMHGIPDGLYTFDPLTDDPDRGLFGFPTGESQIPFNDSGDFISAPYDFVTRLTLTRLVLQDTRAPEPAEEAL